MAGLTGKYKTTYDAVVNGRRNNPRGTRFEVEFDADDGKGKRIVQCANLDAKRFTKVTKKQKKAAKKLAKKRTTAKPTIYPTGATDDQVFEPAEEKQEKEGERRD